MLDIRLIYDEIDSVDANYVICPLNKEFHAIDASCNSLVARIGTSKIFEKSSYKEKDSGTTIIRMDDPENISRNLCFPVFWGKVSCEACIIVGLNASKSCGDVALPLTTLSEEPLEIACRLKRIFKILFSDHPPGSRRLNQVILTTSDRRIFETGQVLLREFEDLRMKRESEKILWRREYALRRSIDKQKLEDCIISVLKLDYISLNGYPDYPESLFNVFKLMEFDSDYGEHVSEIKQLGLKPNELSALQIQSYLTYLSRGVHWDLHMLAEDVNSGILLRVLFRLYELVYTDITCNHSIFSR